MQLVSYYALYYACACPFNPQSVLSLYADTCVYIKIVGDYRVKKRIKCSFHEEFLRRALTLVCSFSDDHRSTNLWYEE